MNVFMAAVYTNNYRKGQRLYEDLNDHEKSLVQALPHILESWHYVGKQRFVDAMREDNASIFLDSGAFSAYTLGIELSVAEYVDYIQRNMDILRVEDGVVMASVLDGIGDPLQTYRNQLEMEMRGFKPLPCFHAGEDERYLEWYVANYEYITLGGMVGSSTKQLMIWLDRVWDRYLVDGAGRAKIKVHGFGITSIPIMERYPWYSCDSSSWIQSASFGSIVTPKHGPISVSEKSPSRHDAGQHVATLTQIEQDYILQMLEEQGFTYERLSTVYQSRAAYNLWAYGVINTMIDAANSEKFKTRVQELF
ncbi:queuine tRNA-ribosyltransferase [Pseudomonas phage MiCath]|uniref:Queuine tRNA-ribosyltransferase n=1 Tax=Pseudomonas phage MiCath TaxID=3003729 RepID=A0AAE9VFF1_9CAUD|nr:queuine tRNA-ribosyltransferase [Pseudomonas phage MiCath]WAX22411.1 queuine tRNA-ribosyltransferase [Pseudomonas phage MiCath]